MKRTYTLLDDEAVLIENLLAELEVKKNQQAEVLNETQLMINILERIGIKTDSVHKKSLVNLILYKKKGIPAKIEKILQIHEKLHHKTIYEKLTEMGVQTTKASIKSLLYGYAEKRYKFQKVEKGVFGLINN